MLDALCRRAPEVASARRVSREVHGVVSCRNVNSLLGVWLLLILQQ